MLQNFKAKKKKSYLPIYSYRGGEAENLCLVA